MGILKVMGSINGVMVAPTKEISSKGFEVATEAGWLIKKGFRTIKVIIVQTKKKAMEYMFGTMAGRTKETSKTIIETVMDKSLTREEIFPTKVNGKMEIKSKEKLLIFDSSFIILNSPAIQ